MSEFALKGDSTRFTHHTQFIGHLGALSNCVKDFFEGDVQSQRCGLEGNASVRWQTFFSAMLYYVLCPVM